MAIGTKGDATERNKAKTRKHSISYIGILNNVWITVRTLIKIKQNVKMHISSMEVGEDIYEDQCKLMNICEHVNYEIMSANGLGNL